MLFYPFNPAQPGQLDAYKPSLAPLAKTPLILPHADLCSPLSSPRRGGAPTRRLALPPRPKEAHPLYQAAAEGAGEGVHRQQVHHQGQEEEDLRRHQPVRAPDHHLVPEPARQGEKVCGQSQDQRALTTTKKKKPEGLVSCFKIKDWKNAPLGLSSYIGRKRH